MKAREFWIPSNYQEDSPEDRAESCGIGVCATDPYLLCREVLPDSVTIARKLLEDLLCNIEEYRMGILEVRKFHSADDLNETIEKVEQALAPDANGGVKNDE